MDAKVQAEARKEIDELKQDFEKELSSERQELEQQLYETSYYLSWHLFVFNTKEFNRQFIPQQFPHAKDGLLFMLKHFEDNNPDKQRIMDSLEDKKATLKVRSIGTIIEKGGDL
jgi:hypothetical protein